MKVSKNHISKDIHKITILVALLIKLANSIFYEVEFQEKEKFLFFYFRQRSWITKKVNFGKKIEKSNMMKKKAVPLFAIEYQSTSLSLSNDIRFLKIKNSKNFGVFAQGKIELKFFDQLNLINNHWRIKIILLLNKLNHPLSNYK